MELQVDATYHLQGIEFEWDQEKARSNAAKHGISFEEASQAFFDPFYQHGEASIAGERRQFLLGYSTAQQLLLVVHVERRESVRIISARPASRRERRLYEGS